MARRYFEYSYFCFNPLDRGNSNQMLGDRDFSFNAIIPRFNPLDRGNSNQIWSMENWGVKWDASFQSPRSGKF